MTSAERRVIRAAMRWYRQRSSKALPDVYHIPYPEHQWKTSHDLHKACAALKRAAKPRGKR